MGECHQIPSPGPYSSSWEGLAVRSPWSKAGKVGSQPTGGKGGLGGLPHMCTNLLCLHTIDNRIEGRWNDHIEIRNKDVNVRWNFWAKTVGEEGE